MLTRVMGPRKFWMAFICTSKKEACKFIPFCMFCLRSVKLLPLNRLAFYVRYCRMLFFRYGLLGASGCGKTTLLTCAVGRKKLDSGDIYVLGGRPGTVESGVPGKKVGYMPQVSLLSYLFMAYLYFPSFAPGYRSGG